MKIAIICEYICPELGAQANRILHFGQFFARFHHEVEIFAPARKNYQSSQFSERIKIIRFPNFLHLLFFLKKGAFTIILASTPATKFGFFGAIFAKILYIPCIVDSRTPFTYELKKSLNIKTLSFQYLKNFLFEFFAYKLAREIFTLSKYQRLLVSNMFRINRKNFSVIPNGTEKWVASVDEKMRAELRKKLKISDNEIVLLFNGALGGYDFEGMLNQVGEKIFQDSRFYLLMLTSFYYNRIPLQVIKDFFANGDYSKRFLLYDQVPLAQLTGYLSIADIGILPLMKEWDDCIPAKSYEFMLAGLPILVHGSQRMPVFRMVLNGGYGFAAINWEEFSIKLKQLANDPSLRKKMGEKGKEIVEKYFLRDTIARTALMRLIANSVKH